MLLGRQYAVKNPSCRLTAVKAAAGRLQDAAERSVAAMEPVTGAPASLFAAAGEWVSLEVC